MSGKLTQLLQDPTNFAFLLLLLYVVTLTHIVGYFVLTWCWK